jgi:hypothetical protein
MKFLFTAVFILLISSQTFSQPDSTDKEKFNSQIKMYLSDQQKSVKIPDDIVEKYLKKLDDNKIEQKIFEIIPIPPATKQNSIIELIPLYKPGQRVLKYLENK